MRSFTRSSFHGFLFDAPRNRQPVCRYASTHERGRKHLFGLWTEFGERAITVRADPEVNLGDAMRPVLIRNVDEDPDLDAIPKIKGKALEDRSPGRSLTREGLVNVSELGKAQGKDGARRAFGHPAAAGASPL
jgi:hypothetical protein